MHVYVYKSIIQLGYGCRLVASLIIHVNKIIIVKLIFKICSLIFLHNGENFSTHAEVDYTSKENIRPFLQSE